MSFRLLVLTLLCTVAGGAEEPRDPAFISVERGVMAYEFLLDPVRACHHFREALTASDSSPRTSAEALWHMAKVYERRGSEAVCLTLLQKLQRDCAGVESIARPAGELAVELSAQLVESGNVFEYPNLLDWMMAQEHVTLLSAAVQLQDRPLAAEIRQRLQWDVEAIIFHLEVATPGETEENEHDRGAVRDEFLQAKEAIGELRHQLTSANWPAAQMTLKEQRIEEMMERAFMETDDLNVSLYAARDGFTAALGARDVAAAKTAADEHAALLNNLTQGPPDLVSVQAFKGELAGLNRARAAAQEQKFSEALRFWLETRRVFQDSGAGNVGYLWPDSEKIPRTLLPRIVCALLFVESAVVTLRGQGEDGLAHARKDLAVAVEKLNAIAAECEPPAGKARLERGIKCLRDADEKLRTGDSNSAEKLMLTEMLISLSL